MPGLLLLLEGVNTDKNKSSTTISQKVARRQRPNDSLHVRRNSSLHPSSSKKISPKMKSPRSARVSPFIHAVCSLIIPGQEQARYLTHIHTKDGKDTGQKPQIIGKGEGKELCCWFSPICEEALSKTEAQIKSLLSTKRVQCLLSSHK